MKLKLIKRFEEEGGATTFYFEPEQVFEWTAGQYLHYKINNQDFDDRGPNRFFSIASAPHEEYIQLTTKFFDDGSSFKKELIRLKAGDTIEAFGPKGDFSIREGITDYVFIAGGMGITPFRSIILDLDHRGKPLNITLLYANKTLDMVFRAELEKIAKKHKEFRVLYFITGEDVQEKQLTENIKISSARIDKQTLEEVIKNTDSTMVYVSGPETMVYYFEDLLSQLKVPGQNIVCDYFIGYENFLA